MLRQAKALCGQSYHIDGLIGKGSFGHVYRATCSESLEQVAVKVMHNEDVTFPFFTREVEILSDMGNSKYIVNMQDHIYSADRAWCVVVMDLHQQNLETWSAKVSAMNLATSYHASLVRKGIRQVLKGLRQMHKAGYAHRDLCTKNILVKHDGDVCIGDLGSAAARTDELDHEYIVTRWYRAPEIVGMFENPIVFDQLFAVDMWSVGCVLGEMANGAPLFRGRDARHQLHLMLQITGTNGVLHLPSVQSLIADGYSYPRDPCPTNLPRAVCSVLGKTGMDLLMRLLCVDPDRRISVREALSHAFVRHDARKSQPTLVARA